MKRRFDLVFAGLLIFGGLAAQPTPNIRPISIENDKNFDGFELIEPDSNQVFVLAEHWHNIRSVPKATMKVLRYLHKKGNVRILAIEQGASVAHMVNSYLDSGDTTTLRQIVRNTMFWGKENWQFFEDLRAFNQSLPKKQRVRVESIDIEYKMEAAIFVINEMIGDKEIPESLSGTLGTFKLIFEETRSHRESYQGLSVMYYYDRDLVESLVLTTINELERKSETYSEFFGDDFVKFATMILEMDDGLTFDYTNPNNNYKFRDRLIYQKFEELAEANPDEGILCVIGMRHATKGSSIHKLDNLTFSPLYGKVMTIKISALFNKMIISSDLKRINFNYPQLLKTNPATLIKHDDNDAALKSSKSFDYTIFINSNGELTPFEKVYKEDY
ncbi:MAG: erythromycin esterase family protein [Ekhidna sp.]|uniref:erythromycin esterase family protein n=1 Tax=Ekhidna sp. TaxID=2608089 RepID=UPI0032EF0B68